MDISVIIPIYNKVDYVERCFRSIFVQEFVGDYEVVAVDDGSTDGSGELCERLSHDEGRLRVLHVPNGGVTAARRIGLEQSRGDYVMFADADDELLPGALSTLYGAMLQSGADEVIGTYVDQHGRSYDSGLRGLVEPEVVVRHLLGLRGGICVMWGIIFRRDLLDGCLAFSRAIIEREDSLTQIKCLMKNPRVLFIGDACYVHYEDVPNNRRETLEWIRIYDAELWATLDGHGERYRSAFVGHQLKVYEKFIDRRAFHVFKDYYRPLRSQLSSDIPLMDRIAILLPPRLSYLLVHGYKWMMRVLSP